MKICFYTSFEVSPQKGGTERITCSLSQGLHDIYGVECYSMYSIPIADSFSRYNFVKSIKVNFKSDGVQKIVNFIKENDIDIIISQGSFILPKLIRRYIPEHVKIILCHHFAPKWEENFMTFKNCIIHFKRNKTNLKEWIKLLLFPYLKYSYDRKLPLKYKEGYTYSDKVVLLSKNFIPAFTKYANLDDSSKFYVIPNALSFKDYFDMSKYNIKQKKVLIVSRLEETQKRISLALKIWENIEQLPELNDWSLHIIGHGSYEKKYRSYVNKHNLTRVIFEGVHEPTGYYNNSSIFMLTSKSEGWGLTLTEAQQFGCVPLAFNSYASLSDIITDSENGIIISDSDIEQYTNKMVELMKDKSVRMEMAKNAIISSKRFNIECISKEWMKLFMILLNDFK